MKTLFRLLSAIYCAELIVTQCSAAEIQVEAVDYNEQVIYHSPETPGFTSWVGLWQLPDGRLRCDFEQRTGPKEAPATSYPVLESSDDGETWSKLHAASISHRNMAVLADGTLVRTVGPATDTSATGKLDDGTQDRKRIGSGHVERSTDGGKTWSEKIEFLPDKEYQAIPTFVRLLRDGRLLLFAGCCKVGDLRFGKNYYENITSMVFLSVDEGRTWSKPIVVMPPELGRCATEESDFCQLPSGDLFFVHRALQGYSRMQSILRYSFDNGPTRDRETFLPEKCEVSPLPHSGFPMVLYAREGIILHLATRWAFGEWPEGRPLDGITWSADSGKTWTRLKIPGTAYYPRALQLADGKIVVVGHQHANMERLGGDASYLYGQVDQTIKQQTFRLRVSRGP